MTLSFWSNCRRPNPYLFVLLIPLVCGITFKFLALNQTDYANGWDGYYYVMQAHSWLEFGHLQSLDYSPVYPFYTAICYLIGNYELGYKVGSSIIAGLLMISVGVLVYGIKKDFVSVLIILNLLCFSPLFTYFVAQFPKNTMGMCFLFGFMHMLNKGNKIGVLVFFLLTIMTHRMTAGLSLIIVVIYGYQYLSKKWLFGALGITIVVSFLPGIFHWSDLKRLEGMFSLWPQFAPWSFYQVFTSVWSFWWSVELLMLMLSILLLIYLYIYNKEWKNKNLLIKYCFPIIIIISFFPFMIFEGGSLGYRFFLIAPLVTFTYFILLFPARLKKSLLRYTVVLVFAGFYSYRSYQPRFHDPPNKLYELISLRLINLVDIKKFPLVIAHKSLAEMIIYKTDFDALNWAPAAYQIENALRISKGVAYWHLSKYLSPQELKEVEKLTTNYYCLPETLWVEFISRIEHDKNWELLERIYRYENPVEVLPDFLSKSKTLP
ncbi:MAG: EpsG family protein [Marinoscillum sp.]